MANISQSSLQKKAVEGRHACVCVRVRVRACVRACVGVCARTGTGRHIDMHAVTYNQCYLHGCIQKGGADHMEILCLPLL